jgi:hypothetical protein
LLFYYSIPSHFFTGFNEWQDSGFPESLNAAPHWGEIRIDPADYTSFNAASFDAWVAKSVAVESVFGPEDALRLRKMIVHFYLGAKAQGGGDYRFYLSQWNQALFIV